MRTPDIEKIQRVLEKAGVIPAGLHLNHAGNLVKVLGFTETTPPETIVTIGRKYYAYKESFPDATNYEASEAAYKEYEIEQMDFDKIEEIPIPELPKEILMAKEELYEAPASATVRITSPNGYGWLFTIRDFRANELFEKMKVIEGIFSGAGYYAEGHGYTATSSPQAATAPPQAATAPVCPDHGPMKASKHESGGWYCPKSVGNHPQTGDKIYCLYRANAEGEVYQAGK